MPTRTAKKPKKPREDFPLTPHDRGRWCKKVRGKLYYFGTWADPDSALREYLKIKEELQAGIDPRKLCTTGALDVGELVNLWLVQGEAKVKAGDIRERTYCDYKAIGRDVIGHLGRHTPVDRLRSADFARLRNEVAAKYAPVRVSKIVTVVRMIFKWGWESDHLPNAVKLGPDFKGPSKRQKREQRNAAGSRMFSTEELRRIIDAAGVPLKAMILLGVNCGYGQTDCSSLPQSAVDLKGGWINFPRPKTAVQRRCPLWPETVTAIRETLAIRPQPKDPADADLLFITKYGKRWVKLINGGEHDDAVGKEFTKLLRELKLKRPGVSFYAMRRCLETVGGGCRDQVAVDCVMGHADHSMGGHYREGIEDDRLKAVTDHVHNWLFPPENLSSTRQGRSHKVKPAPAAEGKATLKIHRA